MVRSGGRHLSPLTSFRRWRFRHTRPPGRHQAVPNPNRQSRLVVRTALWTLVAGLSLLVYLLAWQLINEELAADASDGPGQPAPMVMADSLDQAAVDAFGISFAVSTGSSEFTDALVR
jgi:hypothetical protein